MEGILVKVGDLATRLQDIGIVYHPFCTATERTIIYSVGSGDIKSGWRAISSNFLQHGCLALKSRRCNFTAWWRVRGESPRS
ncbi:hypothetical protein ASPTUDRAFT_313492 [Aspergillus tubingensis CBS 134.48]|uniref:Uncharacterized protein n=1 Tax=Aspergillus tubingensis (strain CBS 134.48) TaxID=767770 RepID=A0A1L9NQX1_ASPTC|nr:hypothetical protein ASPTUDRAFT_313492 [Aspergillus tubingensis CBS 134.48]